MTAHHITRHDRYRMDAQDSTHHHYDASRMPHASVSRSCVYFSQRIRASRLLFCRILKQRFDSGHVCLFVDNERFGGGMFEEGTSVTTDARLSRDWMKKHGGTHRVKQCHETMPSSDIICANVTQHESCEHDIVEYTQSPNTQLAHICVHMYHGHI